MTAALVGFAVTLALTVLVIDELLERRAVERWSFVADAAIRKLSGEAFRVCATLIQLVGYEGQAERMLEAFERADRGQLPGYGAPALLPEGFEASLEEALDDVEFRNLFVEVVAGLSDDLEAMMARWSSVMLNSAELSEMLNVYGMMSHMLKYVANAAEKVDESPQVRLDFWSNLRVYLALFANFDTLRRQALHEPTIFGFEIDEHDAAWGGLPFEAQREALANRPD